MTFEAALAALAWQAELGADEALGEAPVNRFDLPEQTRRPEHNREPERRAGPASAPVGAAGSAVAVTPAQAAPAAPPAPDAPRVAAEAAEAARDLDALREAMEAFDLCELKAGARSLVFADGNPAARVMVIGEAPGREEDIQGKPFVGAAGRLLDAMFAAIGLDRASPDAEAALYITNVLPWRPPQNRNPAPAEIAMMLPFLRRHVELAGPDVIVAMGNISCQALLGRSGITRLRGGWAEAFGRPVLPMFHPAYLLRSPGEKARAWEDLLSLRARLREAPAP